MTNVIHAVLCIHNEMDRYLFQTLSWNEQWWDDLFVYDDQSTDGSFEEAQVWSDYAMRRADNHPSFMEDESKFRTNAWANFELFMDPDPGDWVFAFDADEFLVCNQNADSSPNIRKALLDVIYACEDVGKKSSKIAIPEIWSIESGWPMVRVDKSWKGNAPIRFAEYQRGGDFKLKKMGCGSMPTYTRENPLDPQDVSLLHFGYTTPEDKEKKYERYLGRPGHGKRHIESIRSRRPELEAWKGQLPRWKTPLAL